MLFFRLANREKINFVQDLSLDCTLMRSAASIWDNGKQSKMKKHKYVWLYYLHREKQWPPVMC